MLLQCGEKVPDQDEETRSKTESKTDKDRVKEQKNKNGDDILVDNATERQQSDDSENEKESAVSPDQSLSDTTLGEGKRVKKKKSIMTHDQLGLP